jgi:hypothetical protein
MHAVIAVGALGTLYMAATGVVTGSQETSVNKKMDRLTTAINGSCDGSETNVDLDLGDYVVKLTEDEVRWRPREEDNFAGDTSGTKIVACNFAGDEKLINNNEMLAGKLTLRFKHSSTGGYQMAGLG